MKKKGLFRQTFKFVTDVISWTCLCLLILIGVCIIWYVISAKIYAAKGEKYTPYFSLYTIISPSMEPRIKVYDVILDTRVDDPTKIKRGDVITFISSGSLSSGMTITHRVVDIIQTDEGLRFITKGDNNQTADGAAVLPENILGKTLLKIPMLGRVQFFLANRGAWVIVVLLPAMGIIIYDLIKLFKVSGLKGKIEEVIKEDEPVDKEKQRLEEEERKRKLKEKLDNYQKNNNNKSSNNKKKNKNNKKSISLEERIEEELNNLDFDAMVKKTANSNKKRKNREIFDDDIFDEIEERKKYDD